MTLESLKSLEGSNVLRYVDERSNYYGSVSQCLHNNLVHSLASGYKHIARNCRSFNNVGQLKAYCVEQTTNKGVFSFGQLGAIADSIAAKDILTYIESGKALLPHDVFDALADIARTDLIREIVQKQAAPHVSEAQREEERRRRQRLEEESQNAHAELKAKPTDLATGRVVEPKPVVESSGNGWKNKLLQRRREIEAAKAASGGK